MKHLVSQLLKMNSSLIVLCAFSICSNLALAQNSGRSRIPFPETSSSGIESYIPVESESGVLPPRTARTRIMHKSLFSDFGFTSRSEKETPGVSVQARASVVTLEMAITENLSMGFGVPYIYKNDASFEPGAFLQSEIYSNYYKRYRDIFIEKLNDQGECDELKRDLCLQRFERGDSFEIDVDFRVPDTNELIVIPKGTPWKKALQDLIVGAATQRNGTVGLGDIEIAARYRLRNATETPELPVGIALTAGAKLPTGTYRDVPRAYRATGRGLAEMNAGVAGDFFFNDSWVWSASYSLGFTVHSSTRSISRVTDNTQNSSGECDSAGTGNNAAGDCVPGKKRMTLERDGFHHIAKTQMSVAPFPWKGMAFASGLLYDLESAVVLDGAAEPREEVFSALFSMTLTGLNNSTIIPVELKLEYEEPFRGRDKLIATRVFTATLAGFVQW